VWKAVILVPFRDGSDDRRRQLWDWTRPMLDEIGWDVFTGAGPDGAFNRSAAINEAARAAGVWDLALIGDADTVQQVGPAHRAAERACAGGALAVPWTHRVKLSAEGTDVLVRRGPGAVTDADRDQRDRTSPHGGGATIVVTREAFDAVGGFDERFDGYGNEDLAFRAAIETLVIGNGAEREAGLAWHLWHKPQALVGSKRAATLPNQQLWERYRLARWKAKDMRAVIAR
jgi:hypothetical protein